VLLVRRRERSELRAAKISQIAGVAGLATDLVQGFRTGRDLHWEFLRLRTGFGLPSSWDNLPGYGPNRKRNILDFMRWPQIGLGA
jgi:hypothetical protein